MSASEPRQQGSGRGHVLAIVLVTLIVMVLGVLVVVAPERMGVPQFVETPVGTPAATPAP